jgi:hypothetical protein
MMDGKVALEEHFSTEMNNRHWNAKSEEDLGGALAGGVITYVTGVGQKIAVAAGMTSPIWPTQKVNGKVVVLGL